MSDQLKFIVAELGKEPFGKSYNLITFDSLDPLQLLQVLTDVLAEIEPKQKVDVREEAADQTAFRIFTMLRILNYRPPADPASLAAFRQGIVQGDKHTVHPVIDWLLRRMPELKERAYLARYLVKVDVPPDFLADAKISELNEQYDQLMKTFKETHKQLTTLNNSGFNTGDIKRDIASMEDEKEQIAKRVERLKRKVESAPNNGPMLAVARNLRMERDREEQIQKQKHEQRSLLTQFDQRIQRLQQQIKDAKQAAIGTTPQGLVNNLEEETHSNTYMVKDSMPKEVESKRKAVSELQRIVSEPAMGQSDLEAINHKLRAVNAEIGQLLEKRMMSGDPTDDKLTLFRQQAAIIRRKKEAAADSLRHVREDLMQAETECDEKRSKLRLTGGNDEVLKGDEFKKYVNKLRTKSTLYKKKRHEIAELRAEAGVLARTEEVISQRHDVINKQLSHVESRKGVAGYRDTQDALESVSTMKSDFDQMKGRTLEDISHMVQQLTNKIANKKTALAPIIKELRPLRQEAQELTLKYNEKKAAYDNLSAGFESNRSKLEQEVHAYKEEISAEESRFHYITAMTRILEVQQQRVNEEVKTYVSSDQQEKKKSFRDLYGKKIAEQENLGKALREKQKSLRENNDTNVKQVKMWRDIERLMQCKLQIATGSAYVGGGGNAEPARPTRQTRAPLADEDRLVL